MNQIKMVIWHFYISIFYLNIIAIILQYIYIISYKLIINAICFILFFYIYKVIFSNVNKR